MATYNPSAETFKNENGYVIDGLWYPRVTSIVSIKAKPALYKFYADSPSYKASEMALRKSAEEGTQVHEAVQAIMLGKDPVVPELIVPAVDAFRKFLASTPIETVPEYVERRIWHTDHRYAGTIDVLCTLDSKFGVLDIKTSQSIYRDYNLQTAAYMAALRDAYENLETRWILRIDQLQTCLRCGAKRRTKGGNIKIRIDYRNGTLQRNCPEHDWSAMQGYVELQEFPFWQDDFEAFLGAKRLWEWEFRDLLKKTGYLV